MKRARSLGGIVSLVIEHIGYSAHDDRFHSGLARRHQHAEPFLLHGDAARSGRLHRREMFAIALLDQELTGGDRLDPRGGRFVGSRRIKIPQPAIRKDFRIRTLEKLARRPGKIRPGKESSVDLPGS